jgi:4-aminobutyrate aminotransferase-like enzyme
MSSDDLRRLFLRHVCQTSDAPLGLVVSRAAGSTVWDATGRAYLDLLAGMGVANVGHAHPAVVAAVRAQVERYLHVMVYGEFVQEPQVRLAARLAALLPAGLDVVYFTSSGAEAVERRRGRRPAAPGSWPSTAASTATPSARCPSAGTRSTAGRSSRSSRT